MGRYSDPWPNADSHWSGYRPVPPSAPEIRMHPDPTRKGPAIPTVIPPLHSAPRRPRPGSVAQGTSTISPPAGTAGVVTSSPAH